MMKFFRKHTREMLGVFMALLMIVWLGGTGLQSWIEPSRNFLHATSRLGDIKETDIQSAEATTKMLEWVGFPWSRLYGQEPPLSLYDWILLQREAAELGIQRDAAAIRTLTTQKEIAERVELTARQFKVKTDRVAEAIGRFFSIQDAAQAVALAVMPSEADIRRVARMFLEKVKIQAVILPAALFVDKEATFSEEEIAAHFEKYKDREAGRGVNFGYRVPPSVRIQYVRIDKNAVTQKVGIANVEAKAKKFYEEKKESSPLFFKHPDRLDAEKREAEEAAAATGLPAIDISEFLEWPEAKEVAMRAVRDEQASQAALKVADWLIEHFSEPWLDTKVGDDGFKAAPPGVNELEVYDAALHKIPANLNYPGAVSVSTSRFFTAAETASVAGIGTASVPSERGNPATLGTLAFRTKGILDRVPQDESVGSADSLAEYQTCPYPLRDSSGNVYVFRVVEVRQAYTPSSPEEVRDRIVSDLRTLKGYERALARAEGLKGCVPGRSLQAAYESDEELNALKNQPARGIGSGFFDPPPFPRTFIAAAAKGERDPVTFIQGNIGPVPNEVADLCFDLEFAAEPTAVAELGDRAAAMVIQWIETIPPSIDEFDEKREQIVAEILRTRLTAAISDWLKPENIRARNQFQLVGAAGR